MAKKDNTAETNLREAAGKFADAAQAAIRAGYSFPFPSDVDGFRSLAISETDAVGVPVPEGMAPVAVQGRVETFEPQPAAVDTVTGGNA